MKLDGKDWALIATPAAAILGAGLLGNRVELGAETSSLVLNATAGLTLMATAQELLPHVVQPSSNGSARLRWAAAFGLIFGLVVMLTSRYYFEIRPRQAQGAPASAVQTANAQYQTLADLHPKSEVYPTTQVLATGLDMLIDGIVTGSMVGAGEGNIPLGVALAVENSMLSLSTTERLKAHRVDSDKRLLTTLGLAATSVVGVTLGLTGGKHITQGRASYAVLMGFATIVALWLVTQELLPEAQRVPGTQISGPVAFTGGLGTGLMLEWFGG